MGYYEKKEDKVLKDMTKTLDKLTMEIEKLETLETNTQHPLERWHTEHLSLHDIKRLLHDEHKYERYQQGKQDEIDGQAMDLRNPYYQPYIDGLVTSENYL